MINQSNFIKISENLLFIKSGLDCSLTILCVKQDKGKVSQFFILNLLKMFMSVTLNANDTFTIFLLDIVVLTN